jgi:hypothetical protein
VESRFPLVPGGSERPATRQGQTAARPGRTVARQTPPLHRAADMRLEDRKLREECWESIGARTRARAEELAGRVIEWFAGEDSSSPDRRSYAVVFGERGLAIAEPRIDTAHRPVYAISAFQFVPDSLRHVRIDHRPFPRAAAAPAPPAGGATADMGLSTEALGLLGNLPPQAQELLQAPFGADRRALRCDWYYEGFEHQLTMFMFYIAGARDVTVATGTKVVPAGHTDATAHWSLTCYRASVARRIGK